MHKQKISTNSKGVEENKNNLKEITMSTEIHEQKTSTNSKGIEENKNDLKDITKEHNVFVEKAYARLDDIKTSKVGLVASKSPTILSEKGERISAVHHADSIIKGIYEEEIIMQDEIKEEESLSAGEILSLLNITYGELSYATIYLTKHSGFSHTKLLKYTPSQVKQIRDYFIVKKTLVKLHVIAKKYNINLHVLRRCFKKLNITTLFGQVKSSDLQTIDNFFNVPDGYLKPKQICSIGGFSRETFNKRRNYLINKSLLSKTRQFFCSATSGTERNIATYYTKEECKLFFDFYRIKLL